MVPGGEVGKLGRSSAGEDREGLDVVGVREEIEERETGERKGARETGERDGLEEAG